MHFQYDNTINVNRSVVAVVMDYTITKIERCGEYHMYAIVTVVSCSSLQRFTEICRLIFCYFILVRDPSHA